MLQIITPFFFNISFKLLKNFINTPAMILFIPLLNAPLIKALLHFRIPPLPFFIDDSGAEFHAD